MKKFANILFCYLILISIACGNIADKNSKNNTTYFREDHKTINGTNYLIITPTAAQLDFTTTRPSKGDKNILLCVPGAYTNLKSLAVDGLYICTGKAHNQEQINYTLNGGIKIINNKVSIFPTNYGKLLNDSLIKDISKNKGIFFQQTQCIEKGVPINFRNEKLFQRRGIITLKSGECAIIESTQPITLKQFAEDAIVLGAQDLLNFDMGSWDEGWYRNSETNEITVLGQSKSQTDKQSNWVILKK